MIETKNRTTFINKSLKLFYDYFINKIQKMKLGTRKFLKKPLDLIF